jgi:hypothetical protein
MICETLLADYFQVFEHRHPDLFRVFLPDGYRMTTLSGVSPAHRETVLAAKWRLGLLITLCDDFADRAEYATDTQRRAAAAALEAKLTREIDELVAPLPHYELLAPVLAFDLAQVRAANDYSALVTRLPSFACLAEARHHQPYNMGMVAAATLDLMGTPALDESELGRLRAVFLKGQRLGRIANILATDEREAAEGDHTSELAIEARSTPAFDARAACARLLDEAALILRDIAERSLRSFSAPSYALGLQRLLDLHLAMRGRL